MTFIVFCLIIVVRRGQVTGIYSNKDNMVLKLKVLIGYETILTVSTTGYIKTSRVIKFRQKMDSFKLIIYSFGAEICYSVISK